MLESLPRENVVQAVHRFANLSHVSQLAVRKGLALDEVREVIAFNREDVTKELMDAPFQRKPRLGNKFGPDSRFSDGNWPVFYAAIGQETAEKESTHHYGRKAAGDAAARRPVHYSILRCGFSGEIVDLQPKLPDWPCLISDDYKLCHILGREAYDMGLAGMFSPSARAGHVAGTTVPAFIRAALSSPVIEATARLTFDAGTTRVEIKPLA
jgi:hypothetical protein